MAKLSGVRNTVANHLTLPVVLLLTRTSITPSTITWFGFLLAVGAAALIVTRHLFAAGFLVLLAGFFDILDGALARHTNQTTRFGAVLDSTLDRLAEAVLLLGILALYAGELLLALLVCFALLGSLLVSYIRARAEALGLECQTGLFTRAERVIVLALGLWLNQVVIALAIIVVFSFITASQRLVYVWQQTKIK
ncbi:MAG: CDP-alcohol phosphatidyltransferase family protein [Dehalococcoidales bacterium]|nr:CDP-alcohol phosphatidyltransferase family protein [Dehalococcoidales bacterium]